MGRTSRPRSAARVRRSVRQMRLRHQPITRPASLDSASAIKNERFRKISKELKELKRFRKISKELKSLSADLISRLSAVLEKCLENISNPVEVAEKSGNPLALKSHSPSIAAICSFVVLMCSRC